MQEPLWQTLAQVREIRRVAERRPFRGYSGRARALCGLLAIVGACVMSTPSLRDRPWLLLGGWALIAFLALAINFVAVAHWFLYDPEVARDRRRILPVLEILPPLVVGAAITFALAWNGQLYPLFGTWMLLFGLVNFYAYPLLPRSIRTLGIFYLACGLACLLHPGISFGQPWPMGLVFGVGELAGGVILHRHRSPQSHWSELFIPRLRNNA